MVHTLNNGDTVHISNKEINITTAFDKYLFRTDQLKEVSILTTGGGPAVDDTGLVLSMDNHDTFVVMSENPVYWKLLFEDMRYMCNIDYTNVLAASFSTGRGKFDLYRQEKCAS